MYPCTTCHQEVQYNVEFLQCALCAMYAHSSCMDPSLKVLDGNLWVCSSCNQKRARHRTSSRTLTGAEHCSLCPEPVIHRGCQCDGPCKRHFHEFCMVDAGGRVTGGGGSEILEGAAASEYFYCSECVHLLHCSVCASDVIEGRYLTCAVCGAFSHGECVVDPLFVAGDEGVPLWRCSKCCPMLPKSDTDSGGRGATSEIEGGRCSSCLLVLKSWCGEIKCDYAGCQAYFHDFCFFADGGKQMRDAEGRPATTLCRSHHACQLCRLERVDPTRVVECPGCRAVQHRDCGSIADDGRCLACVPWPSSVGVRIANSVGSVLNLDQLIVDVRVIPGSLRNPSSAAASWCEFLVMGALQPEQRRILSNRGVRFVGRSPWVRLDAASAALFFPQSLTFAASFPGSELLRKLLLRWCIPRQFTLARAEAWLPRGGGSAVLQRKFVFDGSEQAFGVSQWRGLFDEQTLSVVEQVVDRLLERAQHHWQPTDETVDMISGRVKFFFGYRYSYKANETKNVVCVHVTGVPDWAKRLIRVMERAGIVAKKWVNQVVVNYYTKAHPGISSHIDNAQLFERPVVSLRLKTRSVLSFGCQGLGCSPHPQSFVAVDQERGDITVMEGHAADRTTHCVRPRDLHPPSVSIIFRRVKSTAKRVPSIVGTASTTSKRKR